MPAHATGANPFADTEDQAALRQLARDVAERELAPMARHGDETEEFPQWAWDGMRKAELFGITIGERWGGAGLGDIEAAIVLEELARADVSSAILALLFWKWAPLPERVWSIEAPAGRMAMQALFWIGWLIVLSSTFMINHFDLFGLRQVYLRLKNEGRRSKVNHPSAGHRTYEFPEPKA